MFLQTIPGMANTRKQRAGNQGVQQRGGWTTRRGDAVLETSLVALEEGNSWEPWGTGGYPLPPHTRQGKPQGCGPGKALAASSKHGQQPRSLCCHCPCFRGVTLPPVWPVLGTGLCPSSVGRGSAGASPGPLLQEARCCRRAVLLNSCWSQQPVQH